MMEMKGICISDTHLGQQYGLEERRQDYYEAFLEAVEKAIERDSSFFLHAGDLFHSSNPSIEDIQNCADVLSKLEDNNIPFLGIVGNHERKRNSQWLDLMSNFSNAKRLSNNPQVIEKEEKSVAVYGVDSLRRNSKVDSFDLIEPDEKVSAKILLMHELVSPLVPSHMSDYDIEYIMDKVNIEIDCLILGDYHTYVEDSYDFTTVFYPGSTEKTAYDQSDNHFAVEIEVLDEGIEISEKINLQSPRSFYEINLEIDEDTRPSQLRKEIESLNFEKEKKKPILILKLRGSKSVLSRGEITEFLSEIEEPLEIRIVDKRELEEIEVSEDDLDSNNKEELEKKVENKIENIDLDEDVSEVEEEIIRSEEIAKTNVRKKTKEILEKNDT